MSMLTVKHVEKDGHESIRMVHSISYQPSRLEDIKGRTHSILTAYGCTDEGGAVSDGVCSYSSGKIYIMNDAGSTVGNYDLE